MVEGILLILYIIKRRKKAKKIKGLRTKKTCLKVHKIWNFCNKKLNIGVMALGKIN